MTFKTWLLFLVMETALSLSPGPAVFYTVSQGVRGALRRTLPAAAGILTANGIYFALSATSLGAIIAASARFFTVAKWVGAAYLVYLGLKALRSANIDALRLRWMETPKKRDQDLRSVYLGALTLQLANPKALLFFLALLPQFIDPGNSGRAADADSRGDIDGAGVLHFDWIRLARASRSSCDREIRRDRQYEPTARADRGRRSPGLRDAGTEVQSRHVAASTAKGKHMRLVAAIALLGIGVGSGAGRASRA